MLLRCLTGLAVAPWLLLGCGTGAASSGAASSGAAPAEQHFQERDARHNVQGEQGGVRTRIPETFGALLAELNRGLEASEASGAPPHGRDCLFELTTTGENQFVADFAPALRGQVGPPRELHLEDQQELVLLTHSGTVSGASVLSTDSNAAPLVLALITLHGAVDDAGFSVLILNNSETQVICHAETCPEGRRYTRAAGEALGAALEPSPLVVVTASANTRIELLTARLRELDAVDAEVALALALPVGTRLPSAVADGATSDELVAPESEQSGDDWEMCLPEAAAPSGGEGAYRDPSQVLSALTVLQHDWARCLAYGQGGRLQLWFRLNSTGALVRACLYGGEREERGFRSCVLETLRAAQFPAPSSPGDVEFEVPLVLEGAAPPRMRGLCEGPGPPASSR